MTAQRKILKFFIIIILAIFLLASALTSVMYLSTKGTTDTNSGADLTSGAQTTVATTPVVDTGKALPAMTKEEAQKQLEQLLGGKKTK